MTTPAYSYLGYDAESWHEAGRTRLQAQAMRANAYLSLYDGSVTPTALDGETRELFKRFRRESGTNWCELVVNAVAERLAVTGFEFEQSGSADLAWSVWQASQMDADSEMVQTDALVCGLSVVSVWPDPGNPTGVSIYPEHPTQVALLYPPGRQRQPIAAYKSIQFTAPTGRDTGTVVDELVTPEAVLTWVGQKAPEVVPNPYGVVPYVEVLPAPRLVGPPRSELHAAASIQHRINTTIYNRLVATDFAAFRQISATGVKLARTETPAGTVLSAPFNVGADRLLTAENPDARITALPGDNLAGYLNAVQADVMHLAAITQTPPHYLLGQVVNASGDALKAAETGLVSKVARRAAHIGEAWEAVMRLALGFLGDPGAGDYQAQVVWRDFETRNEAALMDALTKAAALGMPQDVIWSRMGASPQDIEKWGAEAGTAAPAAPVPNAVPAPAG